MALFIFPAMLIIAAVWLTVTLAVARGARRLLRPRPNGRLLGASAFGLIICISWLLPNMNGLAEQRELNKLKVDCGWKVYHTVPNIDGIYAESEDLSANIDFVETLIRTYSTVEHLTAGQRIIQLTRQAANGTPISSYVASRTQRHGLVFKSSVVGNFRRDESVILDYQNNEVLARDVQYWPIHTVSTDSVIKYAFQMLLVRPDACQSIIYPGLFERVADVLVPTSKSK